MRQFYRGWFVLVILIGFSAALQAQIPNANFEEWGTADPEGWLTSNIAGVITNVTQSTDAQSGSFAVRGEVIDLGAGALLSPWLFSGQLPDISFPIDQQYMRLTGWYQFSPQGGDELVIEVLMQDNVSGNFGEGSVVITNSQSSYAQFAIDITYTGTGIPDIGSITIAVSNMGNASGANPGTFFLLDNLEFGNPVGIESAGDLVPESFSLEQNYPNPFNPSTTFKFSIAKSSAVQLAIYNELGQEVAQVVNEQLNAGTYEVDWNAGRLPSGVYFYRIRAGEFIESKKLILMK